MFSLLKARRSLGNSSVERRDNAIRELCGCGDAKSLPKIIKLFISTSRSTFDQPSISSVLQTGEFIGIPHWWPADSKLSGYETVQLFEQFNSEVLCHAISEFLNKCGWDVDGGRGFLLLAILKRPETTKLVVDQIANPNTEIRTYALRALKAAMWPDIAESGLGGGRKPDRGKALFPDLATLVLSLRDETETVILEIAEIAHLVPVYQAPECAGFLGALENFVRTYSFNQSKAVRKACLILSIEFKLKKASKFVLSLVLDPELNLCDKKSYKGIPQNHLKECTLFQVLKLYRKTLEKHLDKIASDDRRASVVAEWLSIFGSKQPRKTETLHSFLGREGVDQQELINKLVYNGAPSSVEVIGEFLISHTGGDLKLAKLQNNQLANNLILFFLSKQKAWSSPGLSIGAIQYLSKYKDTDSFFEFMVVACLTNPKSFPVLSSVLSEVIRTDKSGAEWRRFKSAYTAQNIESQEDILLSLIADTSVSAPLALMEEMRFEKCVNPMIDMVDRIGGKGAWTDRAISLCEDCLVKNEKWIDIPTLKKLVDVKAKISQPHKGLVKEVSRRVTGDLDYFNSLLTIYKDSADKDAFTIFLGEVLASVFPSLQSIMNEALRNLGNDNPDKRKVILAALSHVEARWKHGMIEQIANYCKNDSSAYKIIWEYCIGMADPHDLTYETSLLEQAPNKVLSQLVTKNLDSRTIDILRLIDGRTIANDIVEHFIPTDEVALELAKIIANWRIPNVTKVAIDKTLAAIDHAKLTRSKPHEPTIYDDFVTYSDWEKSHREWQSWDWDPAEKEKAVLEILTAT